MFFFKIVVIFMMAPLPGWAIEQGLSNTQKEKALLTIMTMYFAAYNEQWDTAAKTAIELEVKLRSAKWYEISYALAMQAKRYDSATQIASDWYNDTQIKGGRDALALSLLKNQEIKKAIAFLDQILEQAIVDKSISSDSVVSEHIQYVGQLLNQIKKTKTIMTVLAHYVSQHPDNTQVLVSASRIANRLARGAKAELWVNSALQKKPEWVPAVQAKLAILSRTQQNQARAEYLQSFVEQHPEEFEIAMLYLLELNRQKKTQQAYALTKKILTYQKNNATFYHYAATLAITLDEHEKAKTWLRQALVLDEEFDQVKWLLAYYAEKDKKPELAVKYYQQIKSEEFYFSAQLRVANLIYNDKGLDKALDALHVLEPKNTKDFVSLTQTRYSFLMDARALDEAYGELSEALLYTPQNLALLYLRALVAAEVFEVAAAEQDLRYVLEKQPGNANALNALGYTLADQTTRFSEAKTLIDKALALQPEAAHILDSMGWVLYRLQRYDEAVFFLQKAYGKTKMGDVAAHLGEVLWEKGQVGKAKKIWQEGLALGDKSPVLSETLERYQFTPNGATP